MEEIGIDISGHRSKHLEEFLDQKVHTVVTVCGYADQACPIFPGTVKRYHRGFDDPAHAPMWFFCSADNSSHTFIKATGLSRPQRRK